MIGCMLKVWVSSPENRNRYGAKYFVSASYRHPDLLKSKRINAYIRLLNRHPK